METFTYGAELVAWRIAIDIAVEFRYKNRMMGKSIEGPSQILRDNNGVVEYQSSIQHYEENAQTHCI